jgi:hypothetical protein
MVRPEDWRLFQRELQLHGETGRARQLLLRIREGLELPRDNSSLFSMISSDPGPSLEHIERPQTHHHPIGPPYSWK